MDSRLRGSRSSRTDQYVQASVERSSGAASGTSWIAAASAIAARVDGAARRLAARAIR